MSYQCRNCYLFLKDICIQLMQSGGRTNCSSKQCLIPRDILANNHRYRWAQAVIWRLGTPPKSPNVIFPKEGIL